MLTVQDLPTESSTRKEIKTQDGTAIVYGPPVFLYCPECGDRFSATRGDYFWMPKDEPFKCGECGGDLMLARERCTIEEVNAR